MKKSVTLLALAASSSSAFALIGPARLPTKVLCIETNESDDGALFGRTCDMTQRNRTEQKVILSNGCAEGQVSILSVKQAAKWTIDLNPCLPPNLAQL